MTLSPKHVSMFLSRCGEISYFGYCPHTATVDTGYCQGPEISMMNIIQLLLSAGSIRTLLHKTRQHSPSVHATIHIDSKL